MNNILNHLKIAIIHVHIIIIFIKRMTYFIALKALNVRMIMKNTLNLKMNVFLNVQKKIILNSNLGKDVIMNVLLIQLTEKMRKN